MTQRGLLQRLRARLDHDERGFTMIEVAVAMIIFGVLIVAIATSQTSALNIIRTNRHRSVAANLASEEMDTVRATSFTDLQPGRITTARDVDGVAYTVIRDSEWVVGDASSGACDAPANAQPRYLSIDVSVSWPVMSGVQPVHSNTLVTPPVGTYDEDSGHIAVSVLDRDGLPAAGVTVAIAGPQPESQVTTADGCAFFAFLPAGAYTATASAAGYVSYQGESTPSQNATVVVAGTTSLAFDYDRASTLDVTIAGEDTGAAAPSDVPLVLSNTHLLPDGLKVLAGAGSPRQLTALFPFADGYQLWAGSCADANPDEPPVAVTPGGTSAATIALPEVLVEVTVGGLPSEGNAITALHSPDAGCPSGESYTLGTTDVNGQLGFALPYGVWQVQVDGTTVATPTLAPTDPPGPYLITVAS